MRKFMLALLVILCLVPLSHARGRAIQRQRVFAVRAPIIVRQRLFARAFIAPTFVQPTFVQPTFVQPPTVIIQPPTVIQQPPQVIQQLRVDPNSDQNVLPIVNQSIDVQPTCQTRGGFAFSRGRLLIIR